jgi:biopolymer transport protein ExbD
LVFFLVATTIMPRESDLALRLPVPPSDLAIEAPPMPILLELDEAGVVWWGEGAGRMPVPDGGHDMPGLVELLKPAVAQAMAVGRGEPPVMLKVADGARQQRFIDLLNALAGSGVGMVGMIE